MAQAPARLAGAGEVKGVAEGLGGGGVTDDNDDPDWLRAKGEAERNNPLYWTKRAIEEIEIHLRYGIPALKIIGWAIVALLALILWRIW